MVNLNEFFKQLSDLTRLRILILLFQKELCVCEMCEITSESQPKISRHLAKLRDANLVRVERKNQWAFYSMNLDDRMVKEIMTSVLNHIDEQPVLKEDRETMLKKVEQNKMCRREVNIGIIEGIANR